MHRVDTEGHDDGLFQEGTPQTGQAGTILGKDWLNDTQENICNVIETAGLELEKGDYTQLRLAIAAMIAAAAADLNTTIDGARVKPGIIEMFGGAVVPDGYLECNGVLANRVDYPDLFAAIDVLYNTGGETGAQFRLPDFRGEFPRGWDHARGIDAGRVLGSAQADELKAHTHSVAPAASTDDTAAGATTTGSGGVETITPYSTGSTGGTETRPRNVAVMFIIKT